MEKLTYVSVITKVIENAEFLSAEELEKMNALKVSLMKKASADRKPTAQQKENAVIKTNIAQALEIGHKYRVSEIAEIMGISVNKATALVRQMVTEGVLANTTDKRVSYYSLVAED